MRFKEKRSKRNINFLLIAALSIGIIVVITQMTNVGSQKNENQIAKNNELNQSNKTISNLNIPNASNANLTKPLAVTNSTDNVTKPLAATNYNKGFNNIVSKYKSINLETVKDPSNDQTDSKPSSENKDTIKTKTNNNDKNSKDKISMQQKDKKDFAIPNNSIKKTKDKNSGNLRHTHRDINQENKNTDTNHNPLDNSRNDFSNPSSSSNTFDLPFTAIVPSNLF